MSLSDRDRDLVERAADIARRGWGRVHPNPMVGCVLARDGAIVAEAFHREFGGPHAEVLAIEEAGDARGATAYVSLEPCRHQGKTPPCTEALANAGITRVVFGASDPTRDAGGGAAALRELGIEAVGPVFDEERTRRENPAFHHSASHSTPWVALKLAVSLDGRIAASAGVRTRLTGREADREVHRLRAGFDAILIGSGTAQLDDPRLTVREDVPMRCPPTRIVLDSDVSLSPGAALFEDVDAAPLVVFVRDGSSEASRIALEDAGARVLSVPADPAGRGLDLTAVLAACGRNGIGSILCEGGASLASSFVAAGLLGRIYLFVVPRILGPKGVPAFADPVEPGETGWAPADAALRFASDHLLIYDRVAGS